MKHLIQVAILAALALSALGCRVMTGTEKAVLAEAKREYVEAKDAVEVLAAKVQAGTATQLELEAAIREMIEAGRALKAAGDAGVPWYWIAWELGKPLAGALVGLILGRLGLGALRNKFDVLSVAIDDYVNFDDTDAVGLRGIIRARARDRLRGGAEALRAEHHRSIARRAGEPRGG